MERRKFIQATVGVSIAALAGCTEENEQNGEEDTSDNTGNGAEQEDEENGSEEEETDEETDVDGSPDPDEVPTVSESELNDNIDYNEFEQHLREAPNWSENREIHDFRGYDEVTIMVGTDFDGEMVFDPVAVNIDPGTTVKWEWTGNSEESIYTGSRPDFSTSPYEEAGVHQEQEFTEDDVGLYPFSSFQTEHMKGALLVDGLE